MVFLMFEPWMSKIILFDKWKNNTDWVKWVNNNI